MLPKTTDGVMDGEKEKRVGVGQYRVCSDGVKDYGGEEDGVLRTHHAKRQCTVLEKRLIQRKVESGRQMANE